MPRLPLPGPLDHAPIPCRCQPPRVQIRNPGPEEFDHRYNKRPDDSSSPKIARGDGTRPRLLNGEKKREAQTDQRYNSGDDFARFATHINVSRPRASKRTGTKITPDAQSRKEQKRERTDTGEAGAFGENHCDRQTSAIAAKGKAGDGHAAKA